WRKWRSEFSIGLWKAAMDSSLDLEPSRLLETERYRGPVISPAPVTPLFLHKPAAPATRRRGSVDFTGRRIHFMGAGGIGVSALMELAAARGAVVSGCDCSSGGQVEHLRAHRYQVAMGHSPDHVGACDELVHTAAVDV